MKRSPRNVSLKKEDKVGRLLKHCHKLLVSARFTRKCFAITSDTILMCPRLAFHVFDYFSRLLLPENRSQQYRYGVVCTSEVDLLLTRCRCRAYIFPGVIIRVTFLRMRDKCKTKSHPCAAKLKKDLWSKYHELFVNSPVVIILKSCLNVRSIY